MTLAVWLVCIVLVPLVMAALRHPVLGFVAGVVLGVIVTNVGRSTPDPFDGVVYGFAYLATGWGALIATFMGVVLRRAVQAYRGSGRSA